MPRSCSASTGANRRRWRREHPGVAPNNAVWNVAVTADVGTLDLTSLTSPITLSAIEALIYDGQAEPGQPHGGAPAVPTRSCTHRARPPRRAVFRVNDLLALGYQNLGATASLTVGAGAGADTLIVNGTETNDSFTVGLAGLIALNNRVPIGSTGLETLTLEGLGGDDLFTLLGAVSANAYPTVNLRGGAQASARLDRTVLVSTGADIFTVNCRRARSGRRTR